MKPNTWNYRIPVVTERKPTADELYLRALATKYKYIVLLKTNGLLAVADVYDKYFEDFDAAISHYKRLAEESR